MVKNTKGGKGAKSMARKSAASGYSTAFPIPTSDMENFAVVNKMFGPNCEVLLLDGTKLLCHIRNKFKGRHKSANLISVGSIILIGYRDWENDTARKNCDLLFVYDHLQKSALEERFSLPFIYDHNTFTHSHDLLFEHSDPYDLHNLPNTLTNTITNTDTITNTNTDTILHHTNDFIDL